MKKNSDNSKDSQNTVASPDEQIEKNEQPIQVLEKTQEELAAANDKYLRLYSEFENLRRRTAKEKLTLVETASEGILAKLLPVVDNFERALEAMKSPDANLEATQEGIQLVYSKLLQLLEQASVKSMEIEKGDSFDTEFHEAVTQVPTEDTELKGKVIDVAEKGYMLKEKVLRFAKVITGA